MTPEQRDNCRILAQFLMTVPTRRFDMRSWVGPNWKGSEDLSCGTTACALGWATTIPHFREMGLYLVPTLGAIATTGRKPADIFGEAVEVFYLTEQRGPKTVAMMLLLYADYSGHPALIRREVGGALKNWR